MSCFLWHPKGHYRVHKSPLLVPFRANGVQWQPSHPVCNVAYYVNAIQIFIDLPTQYTAAPGTAYRTVCITAYSCNVIRFFENYCQGVASNVGIGVAT